MLKMYYELAYTTFVATHIVLLLGKGTGMCLKRSLVTSNVLFDFPHVPMFIANFWCSSVVLLKEYCSKRHKSILPHSHLDDVMCSGQYTVYALPIQVYQPCEDILICRNQFNTSFPMNNNLPI